MSTCLVIRQCVLRIAQCLVAALLAAALGACGNKTEAVADKKGKDGKAAKEAPGIPVVVTAVQEQSVPLKVQAIGNVEVQASVAVKSRVDGQITKVMFSDGQNVTKGQPLFEIDPRPFQAALQQAEANLARDNALLDRARAQEERYKDLLQKGFVSQDAYAQFRTNVDTAMAVVRANQAAVENARVQLEYTAIRSPITGTAGKILIQQGNLVKANDSVSLVVINQLAPIYVSFAVPEQYLGAIRKYMAKGKLNVEAVPTGSDTGGTAAPAAKGTLAFVDNTIDTATGTVRLRASFPNADKALWPGQFVSTSITLDEQHNAMVLPSQAVQTGPKGQYVYVVKGNVAEMRDIAVERVDGAQTLVAKGLAAGEQVVTAGQSRLVPGIKVSVKSDPKK